MKFIGKILFVTLAAIGFVVAFFAISLYQLCQKATGTQKTASAGTGAGSWFGPYTSRSEVQERTGYSFRGCQYCGGTIMRFATACPHCGQKHP